MADLLPNPPTTQGARWPRDWHDYSNYQVVHERYIEALIDEGLIVSHSLHFRESFDLDGLYLVNLFGRVHTRNGSVLVVNKLLDVQRRHGGRSYVLTEEYDYHACVGRRPVTQDLFRYDNCHGGVDTLHRHCFDADGNQ